MSIKNKFDDKEVDNLKLTLEIESQNKHIQALNL